MSIGLQIFIRASCPKPGPEGPSINSWNSSAEIPSFTSQKQYTGPVLVTAFAEWLKNPFSLLAATASSHPPPGYIAA